MGKMEGVWPPVVAEAGFGLSVGLVVCPKKEKAGWVGG